MKAWQLVYYDEYRMRIESIGPAFTSHADAEKYVARLERFSDMQEVKKSKSKMPIPEIEEIAFCRPEVIELLDREDCRYFVWFTDDEVSSVCSEPITDYNDLQIWDERGMWTWGGGYRVDVIATGFDDAIEKAKLRWAEYLKEQAA